MCRLGGVGKKAYGLGICKLYQRQHSLMAIESITGPRPSYGLA